MGKDAAHLLEEFDTLPAADKQAVAVEILRRTRDLPIDSGPLSDEEIGQAGREVFAFLDREEDAAGKRLGLALRPRNDGENTALFSR